MFVKRIQRLPKKVKELLHCASKTASAQGVRIYLVGGIVRDLILGESNLDLDIVVEGNAIAFGKSVAHRLGGTLRTHHAFGTATIHYKGFKIDLATARRESYSRWGALPSVTPATLGEDLFRRDFTINAMAISLNKDDYGALIDFYDGYHDLRRGLIRVLHPDSFLDDPTRIFRSIKFEIRFSFHIERRTLKLIKKALRLRALSWVGEHRLRDELIGILRERKPYKYIKRINQLVGFKFIHKAIRMRKEDFYLCLRIANTINMYKEKLKKHRKLQEPMLYLMAIIHRLKTKEVSHFCHHFGLRKGERILLISCVAYKEKIKKIKKKNFSKVALFKLLKDISFETITFFYAYYKDEKIRRLLLYFLGHLSSLTLKTKAKDLRKFELLPEKKYSKVLTQLLYRKIEKDLSSKKEELRELKKIVKYQLI
jgi:tRNA nucleotidyltransferase (CCA-adding enzyme)